MLRTLVPSDSTDVFRSMQVLKSSKTPYSDATQVSSINISAELFSQYTYIFFSGSALQFDISFYFSCCCCCCCFSFSAAAAISISGVPLVIALFHFKPYTHISHIELISYRKTCCLNVKRRWLCNIVCKSHWGISYLKINWHSWITAAAFLLSSSLVYWNRVEFTASQLIAASCYLLLSAKNSLRKKKYLT